MPIDATNTDRYHWEPCFVDPWRGVAHFDGLTIEADPITSARPNRVLPCIEDEQVLFCRMVEAIIGKSATGKLAIDLGTGSGVLALHAAIRLGLQVEGVDCCKRAISFAEHNKASNKALLSKKGTTLEFERGDYRTNEWIGMRRGKADFVLLNAPFSPGLQEANLPRSANGGIDGQEVFQSAISAAFELLKEDGRLFAVQLLLTDARGKPLHDLIGEENGSSRWSSVQIYPVLSQRPIPRSQVLAKQCQGQTQDVKSATGAFLSMSFLEFTKRNESRPKDPILSLHKELPLKGTPAWTWNERLTWHCAVLKNTTPADSERGESPNPEHLDLGDDALPSIALFIHRSHAPLDRANETSDLALSPIQANLDRWITLNGLLAPVSDSSRPSFDCIMVESAPWHPAQRRLDLRTETAIWSRTVPSQQTTPQPAVSRALFRILHEIEHINSKKRSVFRHPALENQGEHRLWQPAILSIFSENDQDIRGMINASPDLAGPQEPVKSSTKKPKVTESKRTATYLHPLREFNVTENNPTALSLRQCIDAALLAYTGICRQEGLLGEGNATSYFFAIPMPSPQPRSPSGTSGTVYVYGWSTQPWSPNHESMLLDVSRVAANLYGEHYSEATRRELTAIERGSLMSSAAHEVHKLLDTINPAMSKDYATLLQDYLRLHLEILPFGTTFADPANILRKDTKDGISRLAGISYLYRVLCEERPDPASVTPGFIKQTVADSRTLIEIDQELHKLCIGEIPDRTALHLIAAFVAGLRNAISHCKKLGRSDQKIRISLHSDFIVITNSYISPSTDEVDQSGFEEKRSKDLPGTESVLQYHQRQIRGGLALRSDLSTIHKVSSTDQGQNMFRHEWETRIALPKTPTKSILS